MLCCDKTFLYLRPVLCHVCITFFPKLGLIGREEDVAHFSQKVTEVNYHFILIKQWNRKGGNINSRIMLLMTNQ